MTSSTITISSSSSLGSQQVTQSDGVDRLSKLTTPVLQMIFGYACPQNAIAELPKIFPKEYAAKDKEAQEEELNHLSSRLLLGGGIAAIRYKVLSRHFNKSFSDAWSKTWSAGVVSAMPSPLSMDYSTMREMVERKCVTLCQIYILGHPKTFSEKINVRSLLRNAVIIGEDPALIKIFLHVIQKKRLWGALFERLSTIVDWNQEGIEVVERWEPKLRNKSPIESIEILNEKLASKNAGSDNQLEHSIKAYEKQIAINEFMRQAPFKVRCRSFGIRILRNGIHILQKGIRILKKIINIARIILYIVVAGPILCKLAVVLVATVVIPPIYVEKLLNHISQGRMGTKARKICSYVLGFIFSPIITPAVLLAHSCFLVREKILDRTQLNSTIKKILMIPLGIIIFPIACPFVAFNIVDNRWFR